ncbi:MAG: DUF4058 family protein, partial [Fimbriimonadales bacterium]|nr:DUF4058 family protein [Fimbriimonadales bacterium]
MRCSKRKRYNPVAEATAMGNPFPGMNPYLESRRYWNDFHTRLMTYICDVLQAQILPRYVARLEERVLVEESRRESQPDVIILRPQERAVGGAATLEASYAPPQVLYVEEELHTEAFVQILDREQNLRLVTLIEVLSPTNKETNTKGRELYLRKQGEVLKSDVHLVEIDLLRGGEYTLAPPRSKVVERFGDRWHYLISISRADDPHNFWLYPLTVRERLPVIPIPLAVGDGFASLDMQAVVNQCYENGAYEVTLDYHKP